MEEWGCKPLGSIDALDLRDRVVGAFDGLLIDTNGNRPVFLVLRDTTGDEPRWVVVPVGDAWFDQTTHAIRVDTKRPAMPAFSPDEFETMTADEARAYERRVLAACCPEVGLHRDGTPDYERHAGFQCPPWIRPAVAPAANRPSR